MNQADIFGAGARRLQMTESIELTIQSLQAYGAEHEHWGLAWSGGKDSSATLTLIMYLLDTGKVRRPKTLTVFYADTRQELPPLAVAARQIMDELEERGIRCEVVTAPMDKRFMVYILGRGVPPPNNNTLRWCTRQIKIDPMEQALRDRLDQLDGQILMITGVRQGESAIRDRRIEMSCGKDGAECGQGWYQQVLPNAKGLRGQRMGPLTLEARLMGLERVLGIQGEINAAARALGRPEIDLINAEEEARIRNLIAAGTWPQGWEGDEPIATTVMDVVYQNGAVQPRLFSESEM